MTPFELGQQFAVETALGTGNPRPPLEGWADQFQRLRGMEEARRLLGDRFFAEKLREFSRGCLSGAYGILEKPVRGDPRA
jgi:hypothetical protein